MDALYFFSIPFVSAFNVSQIFIIPLVVAVLALGWYALNGRLSRLPVINLDKFIALFLATVLISVAVNALRLSPKNLNHVFAIFAGYFLFYAGAERLAQRLTIDRLLGILYASYLCACCFGILEFLIVNFTSFNLGAIVFRPAVEDYTPGFLDIVLIRARSLFEESGYFAGYLATLAPLMVYYLWEVRKSRAHKVIFLTLSLGCYFVAFSVSLFIFLPFAVLSTIFLRTLAERRLSRGVLLGYALLAMLVIGVASSETLMEVLFYRKFEGNSFEDRSQKFTVTIDVVSAAPWLQTMFGFGPGSYFNLGVKPAISVYLNFLRDVGVVGLTAYVLMVGYFLFDLFRDRSKLGVALFTSALCVQLFYIATPIYFLPHYFLPMVLYRMRLARSRSAAEPSRGEVARLAAAGPGS